MTKFSPGHPVGFLEMVLRDRIGRANGHWARGDRGASAVEWVVISAIVVAIALAIGVILTRALDTKAKEVETQIGTSGNSGP
jgi:hypothetical protein